VKEDNMHHSSSPDHRLESAQLPDPQTGPAEIYAAANFESHYEVTRRDFLREGSKAAGILVLASTLLPGCAPKRITIQVPRKVRLKAGTTLLNAPGGQPVRVTSGPEVFDFLEERGDHVKVKSPRDREPLWVRKMEAIYEDFEERSQPCGAPIPPGYRCTCNCVPVYTAPRTRTRTYCRCDQVCTCNLIPVS
jgi:hypothetical protein